ncbi:hypothetical protein [Endozoicomonas sp. ONNA2]|uniref:hypothetical protein n=1 Tax=Endozoicomonas sp. ONNA2 TaxID=2828741 RepID=UPI0021473A82|nr:hypothetical protein [Endozoicomonas sp. ONNA2]
MSADADVEIESLGKLTLYESSSENLQTQIDSLSDDVSQMLSAPVFESIQGVRFFTDAQTNNVISGTFSIYGLKK